MQRELYKRMDSFSRLANPSSDEFSDGLSGKNIKFLGQEETAKTDGKYIGDLPSCNKHEPLDASHVARIMAREYKQEKVQLEEKIAVLQAQCNAKEKEIAYLKETVSAKDREISHLKETVAELQQNGQKEETDFAKQMETLDEELKKTKGNISQAQEHFLKKKAEVPYLRSEPELFNAQDYFDPQPSWFDTLNTGCLEVVMHPVRAKDLDAKKANDSSDRRANPNISKTAEHSQDQCHWDQLKLRPPPVNSAAVASKAEQGNPIDRTDNVEAKTIDTAQKRNPFRKAAKGNGYLHDRPLPCVPAVSTVLYGSPMPNTYPVYAFAAQSNAKPFPYVEKPGFLARTFGDWFGF